MVDEESMGATLLGRLGRGCVEALSVLSTDQSDQA